MYNPYAILGVSPSDSKDTVKAKYKALCRKYHPDNLKTGNNDKFMEINEAWKYLESHSNMAFRSGITKCWHHKTTFTVEKA